MSNVCVGTLQRRQFAVSVLLPRSERDPRCDRDVTGVVDQLWAGSGRTEARFPDARVDVLGEGLVCPDPLEIEG